MAIVDALRQYIQDNHIPQNKLACKSGLSENQVSLVLNGKRKLYADEYVRICDALCVAYDRFAQESRRQQDDGESGPAR